MSNKYIFGLKTTRTNLLVLYRAYSSRSPGWAGCAIKADWIAWLVLFCWCVAEDYCSNLPPTEYQYCGYDGGIVPPPTLQRHLKLGSARNGFIAWSWIYWGSKGKPKKWSRQKRVRPQCSFKQLNEFRLEYLSSSPVGDPILYWMCIGRSCSGDPWWEMIPAAQYSSAHIHYSI